MQSHKCGTCGSPLPEELLKNYGGKFREWRMSLGLTQPQIGVRLGVSERTIQAWESGEDYPHRTARILLAHLGFNSNLTTSRRKNKHE